MSEKEQFIKLPFPIYDSAAFATLSPIDIAVLLLLLRKHNGNNNGNIPLGVTEITTRCRCGRATALRALTNLQTAGLIHLVRKGHLVPEIGRANVASRWRLAFVPTKEAQP